MDKLKYEKNLFFAGHKLIGSIDEAGRGPLAGPVVAACVLIGDDFRFKKSLEEIKDSKKISPKKREHLFEVVKNEFFYGIGICDHAEIDELNIFNATFLAMRRAVEALLKKPDFIAVDGKYKIPGIDIEQQAIIKGDDKIFSISAASIVAKVTRDRLMNEYHIKFPEYCFNQHKGYGTKKHLEMLAKHGPSLIHRKSFSPVRCIACE